MSGDLCAVGASGLGEGTEAGEEEGVDDEVVSKDYPKGDVELGKAPLWGGIDDPAPAAGEACAVARSGHCGKHAWRVSTAKSKQSMTKQAAGK